MIIQKILLTISFVCMLTLIISVIMASIDRDRQDFWHKSVVVSAVTASILLIVGAIISLWGIV